MNSLIFKHGNSNIHGQMQSLRRLWFDRKMKLTVWSRLKPDPLGEPALSLILLFGPRGPLKLLSCLHCRGVSSAVTSDRANIAGCCWRTSEPADRRSWAHNGQAEGVKTGLSAEHYSLSGGHGFEMAREREYTFPGPLSAYQLQSWHPLFVTGQGSMLHVLPPLSTFNHATTHKNGQRSNNQTVCCKHPSDVILMKTLGINQKSHHCVATELQGTNSPLKVLIKCIVVLF